MNQFINDGSMSRNNQPQSKDDVQELMNEVGNELGVNEGTHTINEDPKNFAQRMKRAIRNADEERS